MVTVVVSLIGDVRADLRASNEQLAAIQTASNEQHTAIQENLSRRDRAIDTRFDALTLCITGLLSGNEELREMGCGRAIDQISGIESNTRGQ